MWVSENGSACIAGVLAPVRPEPLAIAGRAQARSRLSAHMHDPSCCETQRDAVTVVPSISITLVVVVVENKCQACSSALLGGTHIRHMPDQGRRASSVPRRHTRFSCIAALPEHLSLHTPSRTRWFLSPGLRTASSMSSRTPLSTTQTSERQTKRNTLRLLRWHSRP